MFWYWPPPPNPSYHPDEDYFGGAWTTIICPPGLAPGTHLATTIYGSISDSADLGIYAFSGCHEGGYCDFTDGTGTTFSVPVATGRMEISWHSFIRGDVDRSGNLRMPDVYFILKHLYVPGSPEPTCMDAADIDDNGTVNIPDVMYAMKWLYVPSMPAPPPPFPDCGIDPTPDELRCGSYSLCE
jgi:hypothetical protein